MSDARPQLRREVFSTSRLAEFASRQGLTTATGYGPHDWPRYIVKELVDNGIDDQEEHGIAPHITVEITDHRIVVSDRGSGLTGEVLDRICDYRNRTSSREAVVGPSRGAQGNAIQTVLAIPFALDGLVGRVTVEAHGQAHEIEFSIHPLTREPVIQRITGPSSVKSGTEITIAWPDSARSILAGAKPQFLPLAYAFAVLNPHLLIRVSVDGDAVQFDPTDPAWRKWKPSEPTSPHWYDRDWFERLIAAYVSHGKDERPLRDFLADFAWLSGTTKRRAILGATGLARASLSSLCPDDDFDHDAIASLLVEMQAQSRPIKPEALGVIGREHWQAYAEAAGGNLSTFQYKKVTGESAGLPWVIEAAFCYALEAETRTLVTGINFSPALRNPFQSLSPGYYAQTLDGLLAHQHAGRNEPVVVFIHLVYPRVSFTDRGKASAQLPEDCAAALADTVLAVTKRWSDQRRHEERDRNALFRRQAALARQAERRITIKDAAK